MKQGTVIKRTKGFYYLEEEEGNIVECKIKGSLFKDSRYNNQVAVGDVVYFQETTENGLGLIYEIMPRKSELARQRPTINAAQVIVANVDSLFMVISLKAPAPKVHFIYQILIASWLGKITPYAILTKTDLVDSSEIEKWTNLFQDIGIVVHSLSNLNQEEVQSTMIPLLEGNSSVFVGMSGVGKSTLLNNLNSALAIRTNQVSDKYQQGQHTTTLAVRYALADSTYVVDTPGVRHFSLYNVTLQQLAASVPAFQEGSVYCKHKDCLHITEPKCEIKKRVKAGEISEALYETYTYTMQYLKDNYKS